MGTGLLAAERSVLVVVDFQEKLLPHIHGHAGVVRKAGLLAFAARRLGIPLVVTEQYPKGLGPTVREVREACGSFEPVEKNCFSCAGSAAFMGRLREAGRSQAVIAGIETHVCVAQTAVDLAEAGFTVHVAADACGSRFPRDAELALRRMEAAGVVVTGAEAAVFEWLREAGTDAFRAVSARIKELDRAGAA